MVEHLLSMDEDPFSISSIVRQNKTNPQSVLFVCLRAFRKMVIHG